MALALFVATEAPQAGCSVDLTKPGQMSDILSNALLSLDKYDEAEVKKFLTGSQDRYSSGNELLTSAAKKFNIEEKELTRLVTEFKHCNCTHPVAAGTKLGSAKVGTSAASVGSMLNANLPVSKFAEDVTLHVVLHEMAHAIVREFDLPVLANEETMADAFATFYLTTYMPDRAADVLEARVKSWMIEAGEVPRREWTVQGEHNSDARRAYQVAAVAVAADPVKYKRVAVAAGMSDNNIRSASDYGTEIHRSWRRILRPLMMPEGMKSTEARVIFDDGSETAKQLSSRPFAKEIETALRSFDWHSTVRIAFVEGDGGAGWNRSRRTVTVNSAYIKRFIRQGVQAKK
jgi:hypothetical protein